jgi:hypothetical protein
MLELCFQYVKGVRQKGANKVQTHTVPSNFIILLTNFAILCFIRIPCPLFIAS